MCVVALTGPVPAQDIVTSTPGLGVEATFLDERGNRLDTLPPRETIRVVLRYTDPATGEPARNVKPLTWLRKARVGAKACTEAVRAFRATSRLSPDDIPMVGSVIAARDAAGRIALFEPEVHLDQAALLGLVDVKAPDAILFPRPSEADFLVARPGHGDIVRIRPPQNAHEPFASQLGRVENVIGARDGRTWAVDASGGRLTLLDRLGRVLHRHEPKTKLIVVQAGPDVLAIQSQETGKVTLLDRDTGGVRSEPLALPDLIAATRDLLIARHTTDGLFVQSMDGEGGLRHWPSGDVVAGLEVAPSGMLALMWSAKGVIDLIDLAREGRRIARYDAAGPIAHVHVSREAAFVGHATRPVVSVINLSMAAQGDAALRDVRLNRSNGDAGVTAMVPLAPLPGVLVQAGGGRALEAVMAGGGLAQAPGAILTLRSDAPRALAMLRRAPVEVADGVFESTARLSRGGAWELVTSTGLGGSTRCFPISAGQDDDREAMREIVIVKQAIMPPGEPVRIVLALPRQTRPRVEIETSALEGNWRKRWSAIRRDDGHYDMVAVFPAAGHFPLSVPDDPNIEPTTIEIVP